MKQNPNCSHFTDEENWGQNQVTQLADAEAEIYSVSVVSSPHFLFSSPHISGSRKPAWSFVFCPKEQAREEEWLF